MGGTFDEVPIGRSRAQYAACSGNRSGWTGRHSTLLGPEGPDASSEAAEPQDLFRLPRCGMRGGYRPYFENYTVDASIFETTSVVS